MGEGDDLPAITATVKVGGVAFDLTGYTATLMVAREHDTVVDTRTVDIDADQVANPGKISFSFFDPGDAEPGIYEARVKVVSTVGGHRLSFDSDRLMIIQVTRDPGTQTG